MPAPIAGPDLVAQTASPRPHRRGPTRHYARIAGVVSALLGVAVLAAACDSSNGAGNITQGISESNGSSGSTTTPTTSSSGGAGSSSAAASHMQITIKNFAFSPANFTVAPGATISVTNNDGVAHTLTSTQQHFDSGNIAPGQTVTFKAPTTPGSYPYLCTIHPFMTGTMTVSG
jgi:plastocyanin